MLTSSLTEHRRCSNIIDRDSFQRTPVPATFARHALSCARAVVVIGVLCAITPARANLLTNTATDVLRPIPKLNVVPGKTFSYPLDTSLVDTAQLQLLNKPVGASIVERNGSAVFEWTPPLDVKPQTIVILQVYDKQQRQVLITRRMELLRSAVASSYQSIAESQAEPQKIVASPAPIETNPTKSTASVGSNPKLVRNLAPTLAQPATQYLAYGERFELYIRPTDPNGDAVAFVAKRLPVGASLNAVFDGSWMLTWQPDEAQTGEHQVTLVATEKTPEAKRTERLLTLVVGSSSEQTQLVLASAKEIKRTTTILDPNVDSEPLIATGSNLSDHSGSVTFKPLSAQIVSAGRTIRFPVVSITGQDIMADVQIDRLPGNASFDFNKAKEHRVFHWPTTPADQGEHVFRFTAVNPNDATQRAVKEVLIVIGDPAAPGTRPQ